MSKQMAERLANQAVAGDNIAGSGGVRVYPKTYHFVRPYLQAGHTRLEFFNEANTSLTNLSTAGQLPNDEFFVCTGIGIELELTSSLTDAIKKQYVDAMNAGYVTFELGATGTRVIQRERGLFNFPTGKGPHLVAGVGSDTVSLHVANGPPVLGARHRFASGAYRIDPGQPFKFRIDWDAVAAVSGGGSLVVQLYGTSLNF